MYSKPTDTHQYLDFRSCHPKHVYRSDLRMSRTFKLEETARVYLHSIGSRTVQKFLHHDLAVFSHLSPDIVVLEIGTNDLSSLPPEVLGSQIEELVILLRETYIFKMVCVCLVTPLWHNWHFNKTRLILNNYLTVVLEHMTIFMARLGFYTTICDTFSSRRGTLQ